MQVFESTIKDTLSERLTALEAHFDADVVFYYGEIHPYIAKPFRDFIEPLKNVAGPHKRLVMFLNTPGGSAEAVENGGECGPLFVDGKAWLHRINQPGPVRPGTHVIVCGGDISVQVDSGHTYRFDY